MPMLFNYLAKRNNTRGLLFLVVPSIAALAAVTFWKRRRLRDLQSPMKRDDQFYLQQVQNVRLSLDAPPQSHFRVVALLLLADGSTVVGTNDEPSPNITISMCAERSAFLRYRTDRRSSPVISVYIVTDADQPVPPGMACREYMSTHSATTAATRIVLQSQDAKATPLVCTLGDLHPFPSIYAGLTPEQQLQLASSIQQRIRNQLEQLTVPGLSSAATTQLIRAAMEASQLDSRDDVHAVRYGAAMAVQQYADGPIHIFQAAQIKAFEYSCSLDAVGQLASQVLMMQQQQSAVSVLAVVQVDQFGIPHGLFAHARSFLVEHGLGECWVLLTVKNDERKQEGGKHEFSVRALPGKELAPFVPQFRS